MPKITHVAIRFRGTTYSLPAPNRHHDVIRHIAETTGAATVDAHGNDQGFLDADGNYWTRRQARVVAEREGQLIKRAGKFSELFSEDVW